MPEPVVVLDLAGNLVPGVSAVTILPAPTGDYAIVRMTIDGLDKDSHALLSLRTLEQWAADQGYQLVPL